MRSDGTLQDMADEMSRRKVLGGLVRGEINRRGWAIVETPEKFRIAKATVNRVLKGEPNIGDNTFGKVEAGLQLPRYLFTHFIAGDHAWIDALPIGVTTGYDADARRVFLEALDESKPLRRRAGQVSA